MVRGHGGECLFPSFPVMPDGPDDERTALDLEVDLLVEVALLEDRLWQPNALGISDANDLGFHRAESLHNYFVITTARRGCGVGKLDTPPETTNAMN